MAAHEATREATTIVGVLTALGEFTIDLHGDAAPRSCGYVLELIDRGALSPCSIFRIVTPENDAGRDRAPIDVIQLGHPCTNPDTPVILPHESTLQTGLRHVRGTVSLPRWRPGATYASFFVCLRDEPALDHGGLRTADRLGFAAFGSVVRGWAVLDAIRARAEAADSLQRPIPVLAAYRCL